MLTIRPTSVQPSPSWSQHLMQCQTQFLCQKLQCILECRDPQKTKYRYQCRVFRCDWSTLYMGHEVLYGKTRFGRGQSSLYISCANWLKWNTQTYHVPVECREITGIVGVDVAMEWGECTSLYAPCQISLTGKRDHQMKIHTGLGSYRRGEHHQKHLYNFQSVPVHNQPPPLLACLQCLWSSIKRWLE